MEKFDIEGPLPRKLKTKIKFERHQETQAMIGFVSYSNSQHKWVGVRREANTPKVICLLDKRLALEAKENVLYDVTLVPMVGKRGFVAIRADITQFNAKVSSCYVKKAIYQVDLRYGNRVIKFDPLDGKKDSIKMADKCLSYVDGLMDIANKAEVYRQFREAVEEIQRLFENDFFFFKKVKHAG